MQTHVVVSRSVRNYMRDERLTNSAMAKKLGISHPTLLAKLNGTRRWTTDNLDTLFDLGIITIQAYDTPYTVTED